MTPLELVANAFNLACIILAGRNNIHTWWTGIVGCALLFVLFSRARLPADATLQIFFIATSIYGWWAWVRGGPGRATLPIRRTTARLLAAATLGATLVTLAYAALLAHLGASAAPLPDSAVLAFSVLGQLLLMARRLENWWCWLLVNAIAVPLYFSRHLYLTGALYILFFLNAVVALVHWRRLVAS